MLRIRTKEAELVIEGNTIMDTDGNLFNGVCHTDRGDTIHVVNGKFHRDNQPAIEWADGKVEYYENGVYIHNPNTLFQD